MRHPSKIGAYCSRKFRNTTDTAPTGTGRMPTKVTGVRGSPPRVAYRQADEIPGRRDSLNLASAILFGVFARMLGKRPNQSNLGEPK